jgi:two-component system, response regulator YesN
LLHIGNVINREKGCAAALDILLIKRLTNEIRHFDNTQIINIKNYYNFLDTQINKFIEDRNCIIPYEFENVRSLWMSISSANTLSELENMIVDKINFINEFIKNESAHDSVVWKIKKYINDNISNPDLSISTIADNLFLTNTYICSLFKKETGETINQYIISIRIKTAKEYLSDRNIKLADVSKKIGYSDSKYFSKVFKKNVGIIPSDYRERHMK